eukprot:g8747.t1
MELSLCREDTIPISPVPECNPITNSQLEQLVELLVNSRNTVVITGAGISTESGIPDYRGPAGAYTFGYSPMTHQKFMSTDRARSRYWARNFAAWEEFRNRAPNETHWKLTKLQKLNWIDWIVTQNVDRLHHKAGATQIIELHGTTHEVICTGCGDIRPRTEFQKELSALNSIDEIKPKEPHSHDTEDALKKDPALIRPDGDVELYGAERGFRVPLCDKCVSGILKPDVVFFGDNVPKLRSQKCLEVCGSCEMLLVIGSSVMTYSAFRLVKAAKSNEAKIAVVNVGETRADDLVDLKIECIASEVLCRLATHSSLMTPRIL